MSSDFRTSKHLYQQAKTVIPGGVNSPVRAFNAVGGHPIFFEKGEGAYLYDVDGHRYIDYVGSWGPLLLGHAHPDIIHAVQSQLKKGLSFGAPCELETQLATTICTLMPSIEQVRMVNSGTEATMSAIRLARAATGRDRIIKFSGGYHGHSDSLLVHAGSGASTLGTPSSPGVPSAVAELTISLPYNDSQRLRDCFLTQGSHIACVIIEPVAGNMSCIPARKAFLTELKQLCDQYGTLLIFDEVMSGFRVSLQGAQGYYGIQPDLTTLGKIIGGGLPVGAFGGRLDLMQQLAPIGPVYQAGTLSGNPLCMAAGLAMLQALQRPGVYETMNQRVTQLTTGLQKIAQAHQIDLITQQAGAMFGLLFTNQPSVLNYDQVMQCDVTRFKAFFHGLLSAGIYWAPSAYEAGFMSTAHTSKDIEHSLQIIDQVMATLT